jgi:AcrR family transcriptional regulator
MAVRRTSLKPRKQPSQQRSAGMVAAILEAAARILEREGLERFNTNRVAALAGVSVGSLYQYFPNKDALTVALIEHTQADLDTALAHAAGACAGRTLVASLRFLARAAIAWQARRPLLAAALDYEERRLPVGPLLDASGCAIRGHIVTVLGRHAGEIVVSDLAAAATDIRAMAQALIDASPEALPPDIEDRIVRAALGYLTTPISALKASDQAAVGSKATGCSTLRTTTAEPVSTCTGRPPPSTTLKPPRAT